MRAGKEEIMRNKKVIELTYLSVFIAIMFVMAWVPFLGFIPLGFASVTIIHIPVLIAIFVLGEKLGIITGLTFGLLSWLIAAFRPTQPLDPFFVNPLISVLPRLLFAILAVFFYLYLRRLFKNNYISMVITSIIGTLIHSVLVLGALVVLEFPNITETGTMGAALKVALVTLGTISLLEAAAAAVIAPFISKGLILFKENNKSI